MTEPKLRRKLAEKVKEPKPGAEGLAAAAEKNRERKARLRIIEAFGRLVPVIGAPTRILFSLGEIKRQP